MPPTFAPVYRLLESQDTYSSSYDGRKRRKLARDAVDSSSTGSSDESDLELPITRSDPYHVAGWSRGQDLPSGPYPHAAIERSTHKPREIELDDELCRLNPPVYRFSGKSDEPGIITSRQHIDNLTSLLHRCVNSGDWQRASRILGLLLRSELNGVIDLRRHNRWALAAEILMRRDGLGHEEGTAQNGYAISERGLKAARQYYERLILQYPHTARTDHSFNALLVYPSLFNIWIFEVQQRSQIARSQLQSPSTPESLRSNVDFSDQVAQVRSQEIDGAEQIANRLDQLIVSPPYDTNVELLRMRSMVADWLADLYELLLSHRQDAAYSEKRRLEQARSRELYDKVARVKTELHG